MRLETLRAHNMGPFTDVEIDLTAIAGKLVAVTGLNGSGKTSLLELYAGTLHRSMPTRGSLASVAKERGAYVEARVVNGAAWTIRHTLDPINGKADVLVLDAEGQPALPSAQRRAFDGWAAKHLPSPEVFFSSVFSAQGQGGFLALPAGEKKAVVLRLLGIERLERLAELAREHQRDARARHAAAVVQLARFGMLSVKGAQLLLVDEETVLRAQVDIVGLAEIAVTRAERLAGQLEKAAAAEQAIGGALRRVGELEVQAADLAERIANNRKLLDDEPRVKAARVRAGEIDVALVAARGHTERRAAYREQALSDLRMAEAALETAGGAARFCADQLRLADLAVANGHAARDADVELAKLKTQIDENEAALAAAHLQVDQLGQEHVAGSEDRIIGLRSTLDVIATTSATVSGPAYFRNAAKEALRVDDEAVELAVTMPARLDHARAQVRQARTQLEDQRAAAARLTVVARGAAAAEQAERSLPALREAHAAAEAALPAAKTAHGLAGKALSAARVASADALAAVNALEAELAALQPTLKLEAPLAAAGARIAELEAQAVTVAEQLSQARAARVALPEPFYPDPGPTVETARAELATAKLEEQAARDAVAQARAAIQAAEKEQAELAKVEAELAGIEQELQGWVLLADSLGREGLQAILIDAAGPEIETLTNDLLHTAFGPRFTVTFETTKASSDGKKELEVFDVRVLDTERGREGGVETLSGGEKVVVSEAISLALTTIACRRSGCVHPTIIRDETSAALDPVNVPRYIAMLRRAADLVGASHILFVSHSAAANELADARIELRDGKATVVA